MKKHWLRGLLLGVSLALLLSGGVALAATLSITSEQPCAECDPESGMAYWEVIISGIDLNYQLCHRLTWPDGSSGESCAMAFEETEDWWCLWSCQPAGQASLSGPEVTVEFETDASDVGEITWRVWQVETGQSDEFTLILAEDCAAYEFVPEPGSIMLLGSGLAGLAGYATLRWRTRE